MKTLFQKESFDELVNRINQLTPNTQRRWGKMNVDQMLAHCSATVEAATGKKYYPQVFIGKVLGRFFKSSFINEVPLKKNGPTNPAFVITNPQSFENEKEKLLGLIQLFYEGGEAKCTANPHSFFGKLNKEEWARLMYKHLDHHLQQFGV
jgi:hypothetical protein